MQIRYIRDMGVETSQGRMHWCRVYAVTSSGNNAPISTANISMTVDGVASSVGTSSGDAGTALTSALGYTPYIYNVTVGSTSGPSVVMTIDLGSVMEIFSIRLVRYYGDGRTYSYTKTQVSADGLNWTTLYDYTLLGTHSERTNGDGIYFDISTQADMVAQYKQKAVANLYASLRTDVDQYYVNYKGASAPTNWPSMASGRTLLASDIATMIANIRALYTTAGCGVRNTYYIMNPSYATLPATPSGTITAAHMNAVRAFYRMAQQNCYICVSSTNYCNQCVTTYSSPCSSCITECQQCNKACNSCNTLQHI